MLTSNQQKKGSWDVIGATYYWNINLDMNHAANTTKCLTGYSKKYGESENQDKDLLLKRKIINLYLNGYFDRMKSIEFFMRTDFIIDKKRDPKIIIIYPTHYDIPELNHDVIFKRFGSFLKEFYDNVKRKEDMRNLLPTGRKPVAKDEFLNIHNYQFTSVANLYAHAARCLRHGHAEGAVNSFIHNYKELKQWQNA